MSIVTVIAIVVVGLMGAGVVAAARGGRFTQTQAQPGTGYRDGGTKTVVVETPSEVRALGSATVVFGVFTAAILAPGGALGALVLSDGSGHGAGVILGLGALSGLLLGIGIAYAGVWLARGQRLDDVKKLAIAWALHHAWIALFFVVWELDGESLVATLVVLALGGMHSFALYRAATRMEEIVQRSEPAAS